MSTSDSAFGADARNVAAIYVDRESAHDALTELHHGGFRRVWVGVTRGGAAGTEPTIESENAGGFMESMGRFFSGEESRGKALHEALVAHGLGEEQARRIDASIEPGNAVVVVAGENDVEEAIAILEETGGALAGYDASAAQPALRGERYADTTQDARRLELREERLAIDKASVRSGEARVSKRVVSERQSVDVPVFHEELYIERRPVRGAEAAVSDAAIGSDAQMISVPLMEERVNVTKGTAVREEVTVGKRRVEGTEHVSDTVRREELTVDDNSQRNKQ